MFLKEASEVVIMGLTIVVLLLPPASYLLPS